MKGRIGARQIARRRRKCRQNPGRWIERARDLTGRTPGKVVAIAGEMRAEGLKHEIVGRLADLIAERASALEVELTDWKPD